MTGRKHAAARSGFAWEAATVAISRVFQKSTLFISGILLARLLGPEGRGLVTALLVPSQLAVNLSEMGIRQSTAYHIGRDVFPLDRLLPTLLTLIPMASALAIVLSLAYLEFSGVARDDWTLRLLAVAGIPTSLVSSYASGVFLGRQRIAAFRSTSWRPALLRLLLIVVLGWFLGFKAYGVMVANLGASILGAGYALFLLSREGRLRLGFDRKIAASLQRRGFAYAASLFVLMLNYRIMILLLTREGKLADVGEYAQAIVVAELIWEIPGAIGSLLLSRGVNARDSEAFSEKVLALARLSLLTATLFALAVASTSWFVFPVLFGHAFANSARICNAMLPGVVAFIVFKILNTDMAGRGKPWASLIIMLPVLMLNIALGSWLIRSEGAIGAAVASSVAYVVATVLYVLAYSRLTGISLARICRYRPSDFRELSRQLAAAGRHLQAIVIRRG